MSVLIVTIPFDVHARAVKWAIEYHGGRADILICNDFPQMNTMTYNSGEDHFQIWAHNEKYLPHDAVWFRRSGPINPNPILSATDRKYSKFIGTRFLQSFREYCDLHKFVVNNSARAETAERKISQLSIARLAGFHVPKTIISNNLSDISVFLKDNPTAIIKPLVPMWWEGEARQIAMHTARVSIENLTSELSVSSCPMIYQEEVRKARELRCVIMGREVVVVELGTPAHDSEVLDWKVFGYKELSVTECNEDSELTDCIMKFIDLSGLVFGSFDIAVDEQGRYVFFEINQQGQFLWLEECNPNIKLLDRMARFLMSKDAGFKYKADSRVASYLTYLEEGRWQQDCAFESEHHISNLTPLSRPDV